MICLDEIMILPCNSGSVLNEEKVIKHKLSNNIYIFQHIPGAVLKLLEANLRSFIGPILAVLSAITQLFLVNAVARQTGTQELYLRAVRL